MNALSDETINTRESGSAMLLLLAQTRRARGGPDGRVGIRKERESDESKDRSCRVCSDEFPETYMTATSREGLDEGRVSGRGENRKWR